MANKETICWYCKKACGNCEWSNKEPKMVYGWTAEETKINNAGRAEQSYKVLTCPQFEEAFRDIDIFELSKLSKLPVKVISKTQGPQLIELSKLKGFKLIVGKENRGRRFYLDFMNSIDKENINLCQ